MSASIDIPDCSHARFAVIGGMVGASIAFILGLISKFLLPFYMLDTIFDIYMYVWPWFMGFSFTGAGEPALSFLFIGAFSFSVFMNFVTYWVIAGVVWCGLNWHRLFLLVAAAPVLWYWVWLATKGQIGQLF